MFRRGRYAFQAFESHSVKVKTGSGEGGKETIMDKVKSELKKVLKMQLVLIPVGAVVLFWIYPPPSPDEERRLIAEYEKNAGWKT